PRLGEAHGAERRSDRGEGGSQGVAPAHGAGAGLGPGSGDDRGQDREQRGPCRGVLAETEPDEHGHEEDPAADAEHPGEHTREAAEDEREGVAHLTNSQIAMPTRSPAKRSSTVRTRSRCWSAVPPIAPAAAGMPTRAA